MKVWPVAWPAVPFNEVVLLLLIHCLLLLPLLVDSLFIVAPITLGFLCLVLVLLQII